MSKSLTTAFVIHLLLAFNFLFDITENFAGIPVFAVTVLVFLVCANLFITKNSNHLKWLKWVNILIVILYLGMYITGIYLNSKMTLYIILASVAVPVSLMYIALILIGLKKSVELTDTMFAFANMLKTPFISYLIVCEAIAYVVKYYNNILSIIGYAIIIYFMYRIISKYVHEILNESIFIKQVVIDSACTLLVIGVMITLIILSYRSGDKFYLASLISILGLLPIIMRLFYTENTRSIVVGGSGFGPFEEENVNKNDCIDAEVRDYR